MALPSSPSSAASLSQACAAAALRHSAERAAEASKAASLAREAAEEAERSLVPRVVALLGANDKDNAGKTPRAPSLRVDIGSGVLAPAIPVREKTVILPVGLGFYLESGSGSSGGGSGGGGSENEKSEEKKTNEKNKNDKNEEALSLAESRVAALRDRAQRAALRASRAREEAERDARLATLR